MATFKVGDAVKFRHPNGSVGRVTEVLNPDFYADTYHVKWIYGLDIKGDLMTAESRYKKGRELEAISEEEYNKVATRKGFGDTP